MRDESHDNETFLRIVNWCNQKHCYSYAELIDNIPRRLMIGWWGDAILDTRREALIAYLDSKRKDLEDETDTGRNS